MVKVSFLTCPDCVIGFNPDPGPVAASLDKALYDDYLCLVALKKQQIYVEKSKCQPENLKMVNSKAGEDSSKIKSPPSPPHEWRTYMIQPIDQSIPIGRFVQVTTRWLDDFTILSQSSKLQYRQSIQREELDFNGFKKSTR